MTTFIERYRAAFDLLEHPLKPRDGLAEADLEDLHLPAALHDYYLIAGNESQLNHSHNRLLKPKDIFVAAGRTTFMEENQNVLYWGVAADTTEENPPVQQGINSENERLEWHDEHIRCAAFLEVMLFSQASFGGGLEYSCSAEVAPDIQERLKHAWKFIGEFGELQAYAKLGCALSLVKWHEDDRESYMLFAGFNKRKMQTAVAKELGLAWEDL